MSISSPDGTDPARDADSPVDAADVASAGRSCLVIILLGTAILLVLCVGIGVRWAMT